MAKQKQYTRRLGSILADIREAQERFGHVANFVRMSSHLFEAIEGDHPNLKAIAAHAKQSYDRAVEALGDELDN